MRVFSFHKQFRRSSALRMCSATLLIALAGCKTYAPSPLTREAVDRQLAPPALNVLRVEASQIDHPLLKPVYISNLQSITPDQAAIIAVLMNPSLRAIRDQRGTADAAVLTAGILPNPQLSVGEDFPSGSSDVRTINGYALGLNWEVTQLISHDARLRAAKAEAASFSLDIAWQEWQIAQSAKMAVFDLTSLQAQVFLADDIDKKLSQNVELLRAARRQGSRSVLELAAAESTSQDAHSAALAAQGDLRHQYAVLNRALGLPADTAIGISSEVVLPSHLELPPKEELASKLEECRLDLLALRLGYQSQEQTVRAAVLAQFPKISIGLNKDRDIEGSSSLGFGVTIDIPIFDRNQGAIAEETATRKRLFDEYVQRVFESRSDLATTFDDIRAVEIELASEEAAAKSLESLIETYRVARQNESIDALSYYSAIGNFEQKKMNILRLKRQLIDNQMALEFASGQYVPSKSVDK